jgi:hypothetical protein
VTRCQRCPVHGRLSLSADELFHEGGRHAVGWRGIVRGEKVVIGIRYQIAEQEGPAANLPVLGEIHPEETFIVKLK